MQHNCYIMTPELNRHRKLICASLMSFKPESSVCHFELYGICPCLLEPAFGSSFNFMYVFEPLFLGLPSPPRTPSSTVQQHGRDSVTLTVQWQPPQYDGVAPVNYTITVSPGLSPVTTSGTSVTVTVPYNVIHTVSIVATNCNGSSSAVMETIRIGMYI